MRSPAVSLVIALVLSTPAHAILGCVTPLEDLARRSDVVVVGRIVGVDRIRVPDCQPRQSSQTPSHQRVYTLHGYMTCGELPVYRIAVSRVLRGEVATEIDAVAPEPRFELACDDRPSSDKMNGVHGIIFLERVDGALWVVDGPDGVYAAPGAVDGREVATVAEYLAGHPRLQATTDAE